MGVYSAMSTVGAVVGLIAGGLLTTYLSWRWVLFVNAPIGIAVAAAAPWAFVESRRQRGQFDLPGTITGTLGLAALVYGLSSASTKEDRGSRGDREGRPSCRGRARGRGTRRRRDVAF